MGALLRAVPTRLSLNGTAHAWARRVPISPTHNHRTARLCPPYAQTSSLRSKRIRIGLVLDRHPLPARELFPVGRAADARAVAGGTGAAEGDVRLVGHGLGVCVQQSRAQAGAERRG